MAGISFQTTSDGLVDARRKGRQPAHNDKRAIITLRTALDIALPEGPVQPSRASALLSAKIGLIGAWRASDEGRRLEPILAAMASGESVASIVRRSQDPDLTRRDIKSVYRDLGIDRSQLRPFAVKATSEIQRRTLVDALLRDPELASRPDEFFAPFPDLERAGLLAARDAAREAAALKAPAAEAPDHFEPRSRLGQAVRFASFVAALPPAVSAHLLRTIGEKAATLVDGLASRTAPLAHTPVLAPTVSEATQATP